MISAGSCVAGAAGAVIGARGEGTGRGASSSAVALGRGVEARASSSSLTFFLAGVGEARFFFLAVGVASSSTSAAVSSSSTVFARFGVSVGFGLGLLVVFDFFLAALGLPDGVGESDGVEEGTVRISSLAFRNASRFFLSSSLIWARTSVASSALLARTRQSQPANRRTPPTEKSATCGFKRRIAARRSCPRRLRPARPAHDRGAGWR